MVRAALDRLGVGVLMFNQRRFATCDMTLEVDDGLVNGVLRVEGDEHPLVSITAAFVRLMDDSELPEVKSLAPGDTARANCRALHDLLLRWLDIAPGRIVNRPQPMGSNMSKPYQTQLIRRCGLEVPETIITNDPDRVFEFRRRHGRLIYKSISGVRSIVRELDDGDRDRLERIRWCPTQFQAYVEGCNVRVHTIGTELFATRVESDVIDYRYAGLENGKTKMTPFELPPEWAERCVHLARELGLDFAGIDLKITPDGLVYCFEVNPCPVFSYYEESTGQPIARAVARYLAELT